MALFKQGFCTEFDSHLESLLESIAKETAKQVLVMTTVAKSGHPGGSSSPAPTARYPDRSFPPGCQASPRRLWQKAR